MAPGPERPDAARVIKDRRTPWIKDLGHPRRSLPGEQCGHNEDANGDRYATAADVAENVETTKIAALAEKKTTRALCRVALSETVTPGPPEIPSRAHIVPVEAPV
jgi:hypothetical protein